MNENGKESNSDQPSPAVPTAEQNKKMDYFITAPLRSANRLMKELYSDDHFYKTATHAWVRPNDAKKLFLFGVCKEVMKICIGLETDKEALQGVPPDAADDTIGKIVVGGITDSQTYRIRKMTELLSLLILFEARTKDDTEYRIYHSAENMEIALSQRDDFKDLYSGEVVSNTQSSVDSYAERITADLKSLSMKDVWFLRMDKFRSQSPSIFTSRKRIYSDALLLATADQRLALGMSYGKGYSRASLSIHPLLGSFDYGEEENDPGSIEGNFSYLSLLAMHVMHVAYKIAGIKDPEGIAHVFGENFEKSDASKIIAGINKKRDLGDIVLTGWGDLAEVIDERTSSHGYKAYKVQYLSRPPLPEFPEDWLEARAIVATLFKKESIRPFFENAASKSKNLDLVKILKEGMLKGSDDDLRRYAKGALVEMHKDGILIPMLVKSGQIKPRESKKN